MSFRIEDLIRTYADPSTDEGFARGYGAQMIVWYFKALQIDAATADLSENILRSLQVHIRSELPPASSEPILLDLKRFLAWIHPHYTPFDYSAAIAPDPKYADVVNLQEYDWRERRKK
jgi:hypothetical protein